MDPVFGRSAFDNKTKERGPQPRSSCCCIACDYADGADTAVAASTGVLTGVLVCPDPFAETPAPKKTTKPVKPAAKPAGGIVDPF